MKRRTPSSLVALNLYRPVAGGMSLHVHRTEKLSLWIAPAGEPPPQSELIWGSMRCNAGLPERSMELKYSPLRPRVPDPSATRYRDGMLGNPVPPTSQPRAERAIVDRDT